MDCPIRVTGSISPKAGGSSPAKAKVIATARISAIRAGSVEVQSTSKGPWPPLTHRLSVYRVWPERDCFPLAHAAVAAPLSRLRWLFSVFSYWGR